MDFYVYAWLREDGSPFYIGKGKGRRAWTQDCHIQRVPPEDRIRILQDGLTNEEAIKWEVDLISILGRKDLGTGCLRNLTDGGEGKSGWKASAESRIKMSRAAKGKKKGPQSETHKARRAEAQKIRVSWAHADHGLRHCSASELVQEFGNLSRAGLSRVKNGVYQEYKGWRLT